MSDSDLEDIEAQLYSQVYHSHEAEEQPQSTPIEPFMKPPNRYFQGAGKPAPSKFQSFVHGARLPRTEQAQGYSKYSKQIRPEKNVNQLVVLNPNASGAIVCLPLSRQERKRLRNKEARKLRKQKQAEIQTVQNAAPAVKEPEIVSISLTDSDDDDSVVVIENSWPIVSLNETDDEADNVEVPQHDDVILVEAADKQVINLDEDEAPKADNHVFNSPHSVKQIHRERRELLGTPDSSSNDFINNSGIDLAESRRNFNFGLHGTDFNNADCTGNSHKTDVFETESSTSTVPDSNITNSVKNSVFNEVDFPREEVFNANNFGDLITPVRSLPINPTGQSTPISTPSTTPKHLYLLDSSSSESDFEDVTKPNETLKKNLPELSPFVQVQKTNEKSLSTGAEEPKKKLGQNTESDSGASVLNSSKKKKNRKKRKSDVKQASVGLEDEPQGRKKGKNNAEEIDSTVNVEESLGTQTLPDHNEVTSQVIHLSDGSESGMSPIRDPVDIQLNYNIVPPVPEKLPDKDILHLSVKEIQDKMPSDPHLWQILNSDRFPPPQTPAKRCNRCREKGHIGIRCTNKVLMTCYICGGKGHLESRCPNKLCTQCGAKSQYYTTYCGNCFKWRSVTCKLCAMKGHTTNKCPDLWRRYHLTTSEGPIVGSYDAKLKPREQLWCSGCAQRGHLEFTCNYNRASYLPVDPRIMSYEEAYDYEPPEPAVVHQASPPKRAEAVSSSVHDRLGPPVVQPREEAPRVDSVRSFEQDLPNFISFADDRIVEVNLRAESQALKKKKLPKWIKENNSIFCNASTDGVHAFIRRELSELGKLSVQSRQNPKLFKNKLWSRSYHLKPAGGQVKQMNMILFGVYQMLDGKYHLSLLRKFMNGRTNLKLSATRRMELAASYTYIFGIQRHAGIDYTALLRTL